ncbi:MAG: PEP-CTERM sorting domain-containing protein [Candidatus Spyradosoma sp.]
MNKHITIAAFLVAGAAFANAAGTLVYVGGRNSGTDIFSASSFGYSEMFHDYTANASRSDGRTHTTSTWVEAHSYVAGYETSMKTEGNTDFSLRFDTEVSETTPLDFGISCAIYLDSFYVGSAAPTSFTLDFGTSGSITAKSKLDFGTSVKSEGGSIKIVASGVSAGERRLLLSTESQDGILNLTDAKNVTLSVDGYDTSLGLLTSTPQTLSAGQAALVYENKSLYLVSGIPEPSAFGLLAGLGALALVAARRRRGRKA